MFEQPRKGDLDRNLSMIMHDSHHRAKAERVRILSEAATHGVTQSTRVIVTVGASVDTIHSDAIAQAMSVLREFSQRMDAGTKEIVAWSRPHLENLGNVLLGVVPPAGFPQEAQRWRTQYQLVFQQRLDGALRDFEIGFMKGTSFAPVRPHQQGHPQSMELLTLKPALWGMSIDLKEVWRRGRDRLFRRRDAP